MNDALRRNTPYRRGDSLTQAERNQFGVTTLREAQSVMGVWTGEKRPPKAGEWYLSGAVIEAYRAPNDLTDDYHIARLVKVETKTVTRIFDEGC